MATKGVVLVSLLVSWSLLVAGDWGQDPGFPGGRGEGEGRDPGFPGGREEGGGEWRRPGYGGEEGKGRDPGFPGSREEGGRGEGEGRDPGFPGGRGEGEGERRGPGGPEYGGGGGGEEGGSGKREGEESFLLQESKPVVKTEAGYMRVVGGAAAAGKSARAMIKTGTLQIGFITMEPKSLFIPQYLDSSLILFVRRGGVRVGHIYKDDLVEKDLKTGDIYRIEAGSAFYLINEAEGQRLHVVCSIDTSENLGWHSFQSFFIAGGTYPRSVLSGFDPLTLSTAFNVSEAEVGDMLTRQNGGPIVFLTETTTPSVLTKYMRRTLILNRVDLQEEEDEAKWSLRNLLDSIFGSDNKKKKKVKKGKKDKGAKSGKGKGPDSYNIYDRKPDFSNDYGSSIALDESDYEPLKQDDIGVYLVNLTAGAMMAPHINPRATEYGIVLRGAGTIQIVYPDGSLAMNAKVNVGDVFWIPRYFPFCQIASRTGPFEFFGFTTSASNNRPQFLVGANSLLQTMRGPEFAAAFGLSEDRLTAITGAQKETMILPSAAVSPPEEIPSGAAAPPEGEEVVPPEEFVRAAKMIKNFNEMW